MGGNALYSFETVQYYNFSENHSQHQNNNTRGEMLNFDVKWCDGSYIKHMLRKGYKLAEWKADMKPVLE